jgi:hypothetical protein
VTGFIEPYKESWSKGKYFEVAGRAFFDVGSMLVGGGEANAVAKGSKVAAEAEKAAEIANVASKAGKATEVVNVVSKADKAAEVASVTGKSTEVAGKAGKVTKITSDTSKVTKGSAKAAEKIGKDTSEHSLSKALSKEQNVEKLSSLDPRGGMPLTGVSKFDELVVGTEKYERWAKAMERRGVKVSETELVPGNAANAIHGAIEVDPKQFTYLDLLHESRHIRQIERAAEQGVTISKQMVRSWFEKGAYEYELRLGEKLGFSEEYMNFARSRLNDYWSRTLQTKYNMSKSTRQLLNGLWR